MVHRRQRVGLGHQPERRQLDDLIESVSTNWRLDRMAKVDRNVLRLAVYEVLYVDDVPDGREESVRDGVHGRWERVHDGHVQQR